MESLLKRLRNKGIVTNLVSLGVMPEGKMKLVTVVGSREMSNRGKDWIEKIVPELASEGVGIVSGMARGVDDWAHRIALKSGGYTLGVAPGETASSWLAEAEGGVIWEAGLGPIRRESFLRRNRILAGVADLVLIVEAESFSGTTSTANWALDLGTEVRVCPAKMGEANSSGILELIEDGAVEANSALEILEYLQGLDKLSNP